MKTQHNHNKNKLTWQYLRDYFSNSLSSGEMHEVEKMIMHDPFSSDAFEGLENFAPASIDNDLSNIKIRLGRKTGYDPNKKQVSYGLFIRIAAVLILVFAASGVVIYLTRSSDSIMPAKVAQETHKTVQQEPKSLLEQERDTVIFEESATDAVIEDNDIATDKVSSPIQTARKETRKELEQLEPKSASSSLNLNETKKVSATHVMDMSNKNQITPVTVTSGSTAQSVMEYKDVTPVSESKYEAEIEEVMSDISSKTNADTSKAKKLTDLNNRTVQSAVAAKPPNNMDNYKGIIFRKIMEEEPDIMGEFEVWFNVNENGGLSDFEVTKSINRRTDRKIIRELKNNGNWTPAYISSKPTTTRASIQLIF